MSLRTGYWKYPGFRDECFSMVDEYNRKNPERKICQSNLEGFPEILIGRVSLIDQSISASGMLLLIFGINIGIN